VSEPTPPSPNDSAATSEGLAPESASSPENEPDGKAAGQGEPAAALAVPGERMGVPLGATRVVADYERPHPSYIFLGLVSILTLASDVASKAWAEHHLDGYPGVVEISKKYLSLVLAKNRGGAWGLLQSTSENVRRPFFLLVSIAAIAFIMTLYRRLQPRQRALQWGLPLVLGGALGNVLDRIRYGHVIDFIDAHVLFRGQERHWPTFNVADIAICVGVGLMAIDMFASKRGRPGPPGAFRVPPAQSGERVPGQQPPVAGDGSEDTGDPLSTEAPRAPGESTATPPVEEPRAPDTNP
jgi:signal peptidase II